MRNTKALPPIFKVPSTTLGLILILFFFYILRFFLPLSFVDEIYRGMVFYPPLYAPEQLKPYYYISAFTRFFTYAFLHNDLMHVFINSFFMLAFGSLLNQRLGSLRFILITFIGAFMGALFHLIAYGYAGAPLIGASAMVSAQMGAVCRFAFQRSYSANARAHAPLLKIVDFLQWQPASIFVVFWLLSNSMFAFLSMMPIAWQAHIGGFVSGFLLIGLIDTIHLHKTK